MRRLNRNVARQIQHWVARVAGAGLWAASWCVLWGTGCLLGGEPATPPAGTAIQAETEIRLEDVRKHVEFLAAPERRGRTGRGKAEAADYICNWFEQHKLQPLFGSSYRQVIPGVRSEPERAPTESAEVDRPQLVPPSETDSGLAPVTHEEPAPLGWNLGALIIGSDPDLRDEVIIVSAHYDHLGMSNGETFAGADDNASGVAMVLEVARRLTEAPVKPRRSVAFVAFDLEERLLFGSRWFAAHPPLALEQLKLFMTADMISRSLGDLPLPTVFVLGSEHAPELRDLLESAGTPTGLEVWRLGVDLIGTRSDYGPFRDRDIPFLFFSTGEHPDYHTPRDVPERADFSKLARVSTFILNVTRRTGNADTLPTWTNETEPDVGEASTLARITELVLDADESGPVKLNAAQRLIVSQVHSKASYIARRGTISPEERKWLVRSAQFLMLSVF